MNNYVTNNCTNEFAPPKKKKKKKKGEKCQMVKINAFSGSH